MEVSPDLHAFEASAKRHETREPIRNLEKSLLAASVSTMAVLVSSDVVTYAAVSSTAMVAHVAMTVAVVIETPFRQVGPLWNSLEWQ